MTGMNCSNGGSATPREGGGSTASNPFLPWRSVARPA